MSDQGLGMVVQTRQRGEQLQLSLHISGLVGASETVASNAVRTQGYNAVVGLLLSDVAFTVQIQGASAIREKGRQVPGEWTTLQTLSSTSVGGRQRVEVDEEVRSDYTRIRLVNGATKQAFFQHGVRVIPIFSFKRVEVSGDDGDSVTVVGPAGGTGSGTANASVPVPVGASPGTTITTAANTALGIGATGALPAIPAGTRRVRVQATGGDADTEVLIREVGAAAGTGILLQNNGSTLYGGADGALENLEAENLAGPAVTVRVQFEGD